MANKEPIKELFTDLSTEFNWDIKLIWDHSVWYSDRIILNAWAFCPEVIFNKGISKESLCLKG